MDTTHKIPLFPLGLVMLPDMQLPLHIFEERYKTMITECMAADRPFGIVLFDGQSMHAVGCMAHITRVVKRYDDGRMDILTRGGARFVVQQLLEVQAYMEAQVVFFDDLTETDGADDLPGLIETALRLLQEVLDTDAGLAVTQGEGHIDPQRLAYAIASLDGFTPAERQGILEMTSPSERLAKCVQALSRIVARNRLTSEILTIIGGNGSPPQSILNALKERSPT